MGRTASRKATAAERQIKLALFVCEQGPVTRQQIQEKLPEYAVGEATSEAAAKRADATVRKRLERDRAALADAGIHIETADRETYRITPNAASSDDILGQLEPGSPQAALLRVAGTALLQDPACIQAADLRMAMAKLSGPLEIPDSLYWTREDSLEALRDAGKSSEGTRSKVRSALSNCKVLSFQYANAAGRVSQRSVEPIGVYVFKEREYLAAWDIDSSGPRSFRFDRMKRVSVHENGRGKPDFEPRAFVPKDWQLLPFQIGLAAPTEAEVCIAPSALWQARNLCAGFGELKTDEIGRVTWRVTCNNPKGLAAWCIANGPGLIPVHPQETADAYKRLAREASAWANDVQSNEEETPLLAAEDYFEASAEDNTDNELTQFAAQLTNTYVHSANSSADRGSAALSDNDILFAVLALLEEAGAVSIPQTAQLLNVDEKTVYQALETLAFCYDSAANTRLNLGEFGCAYALLEHPVGLHLALSANEAAAISAAAAHFTASEVLGTVTAVCGEESARPLQISYWKEGEAAPQKRVVEPQSMVTREGNTYLQAWCHRARAQRLFRMDRVMSATALPEREASLVAEGPAKQTEPIKALVGITAELPVPDWPGVSKSKKPPADNTTTFTVPWYGGPWLPKRLASLGAGVVRIDPPKLANATGEYARSLLEQLDN